MAEKKKTSAKKVSAKKSAGGTDGTAEKTSGFKSHLERIKRAKLEADKLVPQISLDAKSASVQLLWEIVFDTLCNASELSVADCNTLAGVMQKLSSAKISDSAAARSPDAFGVGSEGKIEFGEETLAKIEAQLKML